MCRCRMPFCPYFLTHSSSSPKTETSRSESCVAQRSKLAVTPYGTSVHLSPLLAMICRIRAMMLSSMSSSWLKMSPDVKIT